MTPKERSDKAIGELKQAVLDVLQAHPQGLGNSQIAKELGLFSPPGSVQRNRVTWWVVSQLVEAGRVTKSNGPRPVYKLA